MRELSSKFHKFREISWLAEDLLASQGVVCSLELVNNNIAFINELIIHPSDHGIVA
jgi:hypothetical protein